MNNHIRRIMFVSRIHFVVRLYGVHLIPPCSALNEGCSTVENNYGNIALINAMTGKTQQSLIALSK